LDRIGGFEPDRSPTYSAFFTSSIAFATISGVADPGKTSVNSGYVSNFFDA
jgi:hypothetical protein